MTERRYAANGFGSTPISRRTVLLGLVGVAAGCGGGADNDGQKAQTATPDAAETPLMVRGHEANFHGEESVAEKSSVTVDMYDFYFEPTVLVGSPGQKLTVNLLNGGQVPHTFTIESQKVDVVLQPGQRGSAEVVFPQSGQQGFVCRFHIAQGMLGLLTVKGTS